MLWYVYVRQAVTRGHIKHCRRRNRDWAAAEGRRLWKGLCRTVVYLYIFKTTRGIVYIYKYKYNYTSI